MRTSTILLSGAATLALASPLGCPMPERSTIIVWVDPTPAPSSSEDVATPTSTIAAVATTSISDVATETPVASVVETPVVNVTPTPATEEVAVPTTLRTLTASSAVAAEASIVPESSNGSPAVTGKSTFYGGNLSGGMCSFTTYTLPSGLFGTAFSGPAWNSAANCGACVRVTGPNGNSITAMIVDQCPECDAGHLDLFQNGFEKIGSVSAGIIPTSYTFVPCGITTPIVLHNKSGTSPYWFSMQVVNANEPVASLEVSTNGGSTWQATKRAQYNFFENPSGFGTSSVDIRVTSTNGKSVVVKNVSVSSDSQVTASGNF